MINKYPNLLKPIKIGNTVFRNRLFSAPITLHSIQADEPYPTEAAITHFANKARGGAACVTCAGVSVFPKSPDSGHAVWDVYNKSNLHYLAQLVERIHFYGAKASMELGVAGIVGGEYGASAGITLMAGNPAKEMPESEMIRIAAGYAESATACKAVGFDMVLLHFGHGLLVGQFLSPMTNKRKDKYGGSAENRARFPIMIIDKIREKVGRNLLIEVRISGSEHEAGGIKIEDAIEFTKMIEDKIDLIHVSAGIHDPEHMTIVHPCGFSPPMPNINLAAKMKTAGLKIPVVSIGGIQELSGAEEIIAAGKTDIVTVARGFIAEPNLGELAYKNEGENMRPCIKCMRCHDSAVYEYKYSCSVNPEIGLEHKLPDIISPFKQKKKVIVIGGGPAGIQAALTATQRGHDVKLYESKVYLGGTLKFAECVAFKNDLKRFKDYLVDQIIKSSVELKLGTTATAEMITEEQADIVITAVGAVPIIPPLPGINGKNVIMALDSYGIEEQMAQDIVIIGGGQVGCETALHLGRMDKKVTLIEMREDLAPDASLTHKDEINWELKHCANVSILTSSLCKTIRNDSVIYTDFSGRENSVQCGNVIIAAGMKSCTELAESFRTAAKERYYAIGDCTDVGTVENAIKSAYYTSINI